jgi:membrane fusion protein, multidrug efflux system
VQRGAQGTFVYVIKPDSSVAVRRIRIGTTEGEWVSVQGDLAVGDKVVTDGADRLREGAKVEVIVPVARPGVGGGAMAIAPTRPASSLRAGPPPAEPPANTPDPAAQPAPGRPATPPAASGGSAASSWIDNLPPEAQDRVRAVMGRLPPEEAARVNKMSPDERRAFFQQMRERRQQQMQQNQ